MKHPKSRYPRGPQCQFLTDSTMRGRDRAAGDSRETCLGKWRGLAESSAASSAECTFALGAGNCELPTMAEGATPEAISLSHATKMSLFSRHLSSLQSLPPCLNPQHASAPWAWAEEPGSSCATFLKVTAALQVSLLGSARKNDDSEEGALPLPGSLCHHRNRGAGARGWQRSPDEKLKQGTPVNADHCREGLLLLRRLAETSAPGQLAPGTSPSALPLLRAEGGMGWHLRD